SRGLSVVLDDQNTHLARRSRSAPPPGDGLQRQGRCPIMRPWAGEPLSLCWPKPGPIWGTTSRLRKCIVRDGRPLLLQSIAGGRPFRLTADSGSAPEARDRSVDPGSFGKLVHDNIPIGIKSGGERVF